MGPEEACKLLDLPEDAPLVRWAAGRIPVRAACLDVALDRLPRPGRLVAFGMDRPLYYSVHPAVAHLAPEGMAVVHVAKYLAGGAAADEGELEGFLDRLQPGWTAHVMARRFLPAMTVAHALPRAEEGGLAKRPSVQVDGWPRKDVESPRAYLTTVVTRLCIDRRRRRPSGCGRDPCRARAGGGEPLALLAEDEDLGRG